MERGGMTMKLDFKTPLKSLIDKYQTLITIILFIVGIGLRFISSNKNDIFWPIVGEIGTFLSAVIAVSFIYNKFVRTDDRKIFLDDLEELLDNKLIKIGTTSFHSYEDGRLPIQEKIAFFKDTKQEIIEVATAAHSLALYFESRSYAEFREPLEKVLKRGVNFTLYILDPKDPKAQVYAEDMKDLELISKINHSIEILVKIRNEFRAAKMPGKFEIYTYSQLPSCYLLLIDPQKPEGRMQCSHYLNGLKRADTPVIEACKSDNPMLFNKYWEYWKRLAVDSKKIP